jgi:hypothetical protein
MLVLLHFYQLGYDAFQIALLFLLFELAGVVTNLIGRLAGTLISGLAYQFGGRLYCLLH